MSDDLRSLSCVAFGVGFRLTADSDCLLAKMLECAPFGTEVCRVGEERGLRFSLLSAAGGGHRVVAGEAVVAEGLELQSAVDELARELMVHVADHSPERVFVHAGVVGWGSRALVLPGASFAGKTTLVAALVRAGASYYSDEYAAVDEGGRVHPYARALRIRREGEIAQRAVTVEELDGSAGSEPLAVSLVAFTEYAEGGAWSAEPVSAGMAVLEMLRHAIPVQRTPARVMATLAKMMETAVAVRSVRGEASEAAAALLSEVNARAGEAPR
jgi:serine kinase of HPr protein (carbohydrate metabolism regulator)